MQKEVMADNIRAKPDTSHQSGYEANALYQWADLKNKLVTDPHYLQ